MVGCPHCGKRIGVPKKFCPHCGATIIITANPPRTSAPQSSRGSEYVEKTCSRCNGTCRELFGGRCRGCGGVGVVAVIYPPKHCRSCNGTGAGDYGTTTVCSVCNGTGWANSTRLG